MYSYVGDFQGCGHIRVIFPSMYMNFLRYGDYQFHASYGAFFINELKYYKDFTLVQFQRATTPRHLDLITHYLTNIKKAVKTPLIYEIDDLLWDIPKWNIASHFYNRLFETTKLIMGKVDGIVVSVDKLKDIYGEFNSNIEVIPNHLCKFLWSDAKFDEHIPSGKPRIFYQGSDTHFCIQKLTDMGYKGGDFGNKLIDFIRKTTDKYQWVFMGGRPHEIKDLIASGHIEHHNWRSILDYPQYVKSLKVDIGLGILQPNLFNECKSNIKNLEYVAIGVPGVYSDIEPYKNTTVKCKTDEEIIDSIERLAANQDLRRLTWQSDYDKVKDLLFWEENFNIIKYVNTYMKLFGKKLKDV